MKLNELEIKIQIKSKEEFQRVFTACHTHFGKPQGHFLQLDEYFDTPDGQLKKQDLVIRIRSNEGKQTIALKSPRVTLPSGMTNRIELEFEAALGADVEKQLLKQGLRANEASEKERWTFVKDDFEIVLDRLPFIGTFIEIEGPSEEAIQKIVKLLDLSTSPVISRNYGELMRSKFEELQLSLSLTRATFAEEAKLNLKGF